MWPTLRAIDALGGSGNIHEIFERVVELERYPDEQLAVLHRNGPETEIEYRLAWARTYLKNVGAVENSRRGVWSITERGRSLREADMAAIPAAVRAAQGRERVTSPDLETDEPTSWKEELLDRLMGLAPEAFERLAKRLLREAGFTNVRVLGRSGDGGLDGTGVYQLSLVSFPVFFQCKRWRGSVGSQQVRDFRGALAGRGDKGLLITTGSFTREARTEASRDGATVLDLVDGDRLCDLLREYEMGVIVATRTVDDVSIDSEFFHGI